MKANDRFSGKTVGMVNDAIRMACGKVGPSTKIYADDIRQDVWIKIIMSYNPLRAATTEAVSLEHVKLPSGQTATKAMTHNPIAAFAYRVTLNLARDYMRGTAGSMSLQRHTAESLNVIDPDHHAERQESIQANNIPYVDQDVSNAVQDERRTQELIAAMDKLPVSQRDALTVDMLDDRAMTGAERIAKFRALKTLRAELT